MDKIAYMIMAHRDENHLRKLVERLNYNADFYIYILRLPIPKIGFAP